MSELVGQETGRRWVEALYRENYEVVRRLARSLLTGNLKSMAEDVAQEAMLRAWRQAPRWSFGQAKFDTWLHRVALNLCYDRLRRRREIATEAPPDRPDEGPAPDRGLLAAETGLRVDAAMRRLPDRQREAVVLCHYQEMTNIDAASAMEISVEALESLLSRGRRALRGALADLAPGARNGEWG